MELAHLRSLIAVAELGTFGRAGVRVHLSAPAVFEQIRRLEHEAGAKLYERTGRRLALTRAGEVVVDYARRMLQQHDDALQAVQELEGVRRGVLRFGCGPHISVSVVPHLLRAFLARYPDIELRVVTGNDHLLFDELRAGRLDLLMMNLPVPEPALEQVQLWRYEMVFVTAPGDPVAATPRELALRPFILYQRAVIVEDAIRSFCVEAGFEPRLVMQNDQADSIKELVKLGLGISLLPLWSVSEDARRGTLRILRLPKRHLYNVTGLLYRKSAHAPAAVRALVEVAHEWANWLPMARDVSPAGGKKMAAGV